VASSLVERYVHLAPEYLAAAVERLLPGYAAGGSGKRVTGDGRATNDAPEVALELRRNFDGTGYAAVSVS
jgi:hypothetical protein